MRGTICIITMKSWYAYIKQSIKPIQKSDNVKKKVSGYNERTVFIMIPVSRQPNLKNEEKSSK